jgi:hypothetical protein
MNENQDVYVSPTRGRTVFHESPKDWSPIKTCRHCILRDTIQDCRKVACSPEFRADGKDGYFTLQDIPNPEES